MYGYNFAEKPEVAKRYPHHLLCEGLPHLSSNKIIKVLNGTKPLLNAPRQDGFVAYHPGGFAGTSKYESQISDHSSSQSNIVVRQNMFAKKTTSPASI